MVHALQAKDLCERYTLGVVCTHGYLYAMQILEEFGIPDFRLHGPELDKNVFEALSRNTFVLPRCARIDSAVPYLELVLVGVVIVIGF
jgi:hypothetical protein